MPSTVPVRFKPRCGVSAPTIAVPMPDGEVRIDSATLLQGRREILLRHAGETYRLRHTRNGKLILTK